MNKQIKELRERAWTLVSDEERERGELYETREQWELCDEKFAELIVAECMAVAAKQRKPANLNYNPSERFVEDLRQHFGVEE